MTLAGPQRSAAPAVAVRSPDAPLPRRPLWGFPLPVHARPTLMLPLRNREAFRELYVDKGATSGLFIEGDLDVELGEPIDVELHFLEEQVHFRLRGEARWRRSHGSRRGVPQGVGVELLPEEARTKALLLDFVDGKEMSLVVRTARRYGVTLEVKVKQGGTFITDRTDDISEGGAFILSDDPVPVGSRIELKLLPPGAWLGIGVKAVVAWKREQGRRGFGVEFQFDSERQRRRVSKLVGHLKDQLLRELKVRGPRTSGRS